MEVRYVLKLEDMIDFHFIIMKIQQNRQRNCDAILQSVGRTKKLLLRFPRKQRRVMFVLPDPFRERLSATIQYVT